MTPQSGGFGCSSVSRWPVALALAATCSSANRRAMRRSAPVGGALMRGSGCDRLLFFVFVAAAIAVACASPIKVDVEIVNPCNQETLQELDLLKLEPRGTGIDSFGLTTWKRVDDHAEDAIEIPLA